MLALLGPEQHIRELIRDAGSDVVVSNRNSRNQLVSQAPPAPSAK